MTTGRKLALMPGLAARCRCCGERIGVPGAAILVVIPLVAAVLLLRVIDNDLARILALAVGVLVTFYIQWRHVPLIRL